MNDPSTRTLVDTSSWIEALRTDGNVKVAGRVKTLLVEGFACWNEMILLELWNGARGGYERRSLREMERDIEVLPITSNVWQRAFGIARMARNKGLTIPNTDLLIFAAARHYKVPLEHCDNHFSSLEKLPAVQVTKKG